MSEVSSLLASAARSRHHADAVRLAIANLGIETIKNGTPDDWKRFRALLEDVARACGNAKRVVNILEGVLLASVKAEGMKFGKPKGIELAKRLDAAAEEPCSCGPCALKQTKVIEMAEAVAKKAVEDGSGHA